MAGEDHPIVVVADDDAGIRMLCRVNLEFEGYRVLEAETAAEVRQRLGEANVALVLLDVHLGRDDGRELAAELREQRPELAIAFFTGSAQIAPGEQDSLADGVLSKPFTLEALSEIVRRLAREREAPPRA